MSVMPYAIEPIVSLENVRNSSHVTHTHWGELLCRLDPFPHDKKTWRVWYASMCNMVEDVLCKYKLDRISINLDSSQIMDKQIIKSIASLADYPIAIEWTENMYRDVHLSELITVGKVLERIRSRHAIPIILDDIGSGEDTFRRLCAISPDVVKIDGEVFHLARGNTRITDLLAEKVHIHKQSGVETVIEWIETIQDLDLALNLGAKWAQGYLWDESFFPLTTTTLNSWEYSGSVISAGAPR